MAVDMFLKLGDIVVVEARGQVMTKSGQPYNQTYCYVLRLSDGQVQELTEYLDTDLVNQVLQHPGGPEQLAD